MGFAVWNSAGSEVFDDRSLAYLKAELLCYGVKSERIYRGRKGGAGPAGGRSIALPDGSVVETPMRGEFIRDSPFELKRQEQGWMLFKEGEPFVEVSLLPFPKFYRKKTSNGIPMHRIAKLHGKDCLATTLLSRCFRWRQGKQCKFCAIEIYGGDKPLVRKTGEQLAEVAKTAIEEGVAGHMTITTGTTASPDRGASLLADAVRKVKEKVDIPIEVHLEPPADLRYLNLLKKSGVDTLGMHIETFDEEIRNEVCPGKAEISREEYVKAWSHAVNLFGKAQVNSFLLVGLGESDEVILKGVRSLAKLGVIAHVLPFRPIAGTTLEYREPPEPKRLIRIYQEMGRIFTEHGISPQLVKSGCARCRACGLGVLAHGPCF